MSQELRRLVEATLVLQRDAEQRLATIFDSVLNSSPFIDQPNFSALCDEDLALVRSVRPAVPSGNMPADARRDGQPDRLSRLAQDDSCRRQDDSRRAACRSRFIPVPRFEIAVSSTLLFQTFADVERPIKVTGVLCHNRLEALQRIFEHELIHLVEMLLWQASCCGAPRFKDIAGRFFGHKESNHQLITPDERAREKFGIRPGDRVTFEMDGLPYTGVVNRVTKRATILVEDSRGPRYSDGKRYAKFYIPVGMLERCA